MYVGVKITTVHYSFCLFTSVPRDATSTGGHARLYEHDVYTLLYGRVCSQVDRFRTRGK